MLIYIPNAEGSGLIFKWNKYVFSTYAWNGRMWSKALIVKIKS